MFFLVWISNLGESAFFHFAAWDTFLEVSSIQLKGLLLVLQVWVHKIGSLPVLISFVLSGLQDPAMSGMLSNLTNPAHKEQLEQRMAAVREDPTLKPVLEEIETGGPAAMMKWATCLLFNFLRQISEVEDCDTVSYEIFDFFLQVLERPRSPQQAWASYGCGCSRRGRPTCAWWVCQWWGRGRRWWGRWGIDRTSHCQHWWCWGMWGSVLRQIPQLFPLYKQLVKAFFNPKFVWCEGALSFVTISRVSQFRLTDFKVRGTDFFWFFTYAGRVWKFFFKRVQTRMKRMLREGLPCISHLVMERCVYVYVFPCMSLKVCLPACGTEFWPDFTCLKFPHLLWIRSRICTKVSGVL